MDYETHMRPALIEAYDLLRQAYQRQWSRDQMAVLAETIKDHGPDPDLVVPAVEAHIGNTALNGNNTRIGAWPPTPADILGHIEDLEQRQQREATLDEEETRRQQIREWEEQEASGKYRAIDLDTLPAAAKGFWQRHAARNEHAAHKAGVFIHIEGNKLMIPEKKGWIKNCNECADTGMARFWYDPDDKVRVWLTAEYKRLPTAMQETLKDFPAVCDQCLLGEETKQHYKAAILGNGDYGQVMTTMKRIRHLAHLRELNEGQQIDFEPRTQEATL